MAWPLHEVSWMVFQIQVTTVTRRLTAAYVSVFFDKTEIVAVEVICNQGFGMNLWPKLDLVTFVSKCFSNELLVRFCKLLETLAGRTGFEGRKQMLEDALNSRQLSCPLDDRWARVRDGFDLQSAKEVRCMSGERDHCSSCFHPRAQSTDVMANEGPIREVPICQTLVAELGHRLCPPQLVGAHAQTMGIGVKCN